MTPRTALPLSLAVCLLVACGDGGDVDDGDGPTDDGDPIAAPDGPGVTDEPGGGSNDGPGSGTGDGPNGSGNGTGDAGDRVANLLFPPTVPPVSERPLSVARTLDGAALSGDRLGGREGSLPVPDVDGDGRADHAFLAPAGLVGECAAGVVLPSATLAQADLASAELAAALRVVHGTGADCWNVGSVAVIDDVNGDARPDLALFARSGEFGPGAGAIVFGGAAAALVDLAALDGGDGFVLDDVDREGFEVGLRGIGDLDGDGVGDVLFKNTGGALAQGWHVIPGRAAFPARRSANDVDPGEIVLALRPVARVGPGGDLNGDGADEAIVENRTEEGPQVIYGAAGMRGATIDAAVELVRDCTAGSFCGASRAGDLDADGFGDLIVTHSLGTSGCGYGGRSAVHYGGPDGVVTLDSLATLDDAPNPRATRLAESAANPCIGGGGFGGVGDLDGDGADDFGLYGGAHDGIVFGRPGERPGTIWLDDLDGAFGFRFEGSLRDGPLDVDGDGHDDLVFDDEPTAFAGRGRSLDPNGPERFAVERGPAFLRATWRASTLEGAAGYRLELDGRPVAELDADATEHAFDPAGGEPTELVLSVLDADGAVIGESVRRAPAFEPLETLTATVYGPRLVQVGFPGDPVVRRLGRYLVWRDGVPIGRAPAGATDYVDETVEPGRTYRYRVTPDYLPPGSLDPGRLDEGPLIRRRSGTLEVTTPGG